MTTFAVPTVILLVTGLAGAAAPSPRQELRDLSPSVPVERELSAGEQHKYRIALLPGQYLEVAVVQRSVDVVVSLFGPNEEMIREKDFVQALQQTEIVAEIADKAGDYYLEIRARDKDAAGRYEVVIRALREATAKDRYRVGASRAYQQAEDLYERKTSPFLEKAIEKYEEAAALWQAAGDHSREARSLLTIGVIYWLTGEFSRALDYSKQALELLRDARDRIGEANALNNIGQNYNALGQNQEAFNAFHQALAIYRESGSKKEEARTLNNLALVYTALSDPIRSLEQLEQALVLRREVGDTRGEAITLHNIGGAYWSLGEYQKALDYYTRALPLRDAAGDIRGKAKTLGDMGLVYSDLGDNQKALEFHNQSLALKREVRDRAGQAITLNNIGTILKESGETEKALEYYTQALELHQSMADPVGQANVLANIAGMERDRSNLVEARRRIEAALEIVESMRSGVDSKDLRSTYLASKQGSYRIYIDVLMQQHKKDPMAGHDRKALAVAERARARSLLETLAEARVDLRAVVEPQLLEREADLQRSLNEKQRQRVQLLYGAHTSEQARAAGQEVENLRAQYQELHARIRAANPRYAELIEPAPMSPGEIQQLLEGDTLLLEYSLGKERSFLWAVTKESIASYELPGESEIEEAARRAHELLTVSHTRQRKRESELAAAELSWMLLGPVANKLDQKRLVIVADGTLQYLPFAALPAPRTNVRLAQAKSESPNSRPLILDHEIVSLPSVSVLGVLRREMANRKPPSKLLAMLADPVLGPDDLRVKPASAKRETGKPVSDSGVVSGGDELKRSAGESGVAALERLRYTRQEAEAILDLAKAGKNLKALDFDASRATAISAELADYRIVHFATHALINSQHPELSGIVLSLVDEQGRQQDGFLRTHDIYNLKLAADLVVLSACSTALGKQVKGEGLVGLVRGFMYSGAPRVVASLWDVKDDATAELMKRFYKAMLVEGRTPAAALRAAQVSMWKEDRWAAPYFWAGFVIQGDWK